MKSMKFVLGLATAVTLSVGQMATAAEQ